MKRNSLFYLLKPLIPRRLQIYLRRKLIQRKREHVNHIWPIDYRAAVPPPFWNGWPGNKDFAFVLTHDVESSVGQKNCIKLLEIEDRLGFRSSFNFVPERYPDSPELREVITSRGFEVGVHGLNHDGKLFKSYQDFSQRAQRINKYISAWGAAGFRAPAMHHNLEWQRELNIEYDLSTFDTDPFEPQSDGVETIFPFWINGNGKGNGYVEIPYTLPQDFTLFILMRESNSQIWQKKLDWIARNGGMALVNVHPDYIYFDESEKTPEKFSVEIYLEFLNYVKNKYENRFWHVLPKELSIFWKMNQCGLD